MKIQSTQDYTLFKRIPGNRAVSQPHVKRLLEAIQTDPETITYNPIIINDNFEVIDGQHRLEAIKELGLTAYYLKVSDLGLRTVQKLNSINKSWTPMDYAKSFAENGSEPYTLYIEFKKKFKLNHDILMRYMALNIPMTGNVFKAGGFKVPDPAESYKLLTYLLEVAEYYTRATQRNVAFGYYYIATSKNYDHKQMLKQMEKYSHLFQEQALANDYAREFERIYNYRRHQTMRLF